MPKAHKYLLFIMTAEDVKQEISELAKTHEAIDEQTISDFNDAEYIELIAEELIIAYCEHNGYMINGFPNNMFLRLVFCKHLTRYLPPTSNGASNPYLYDENKSISLR